ncbi:hypothetical protein ARMGADRAFT_1069776 [Armillaria gallica]|uniref:Uncharacterized protein n=1 Tax=Armillaria gallica TaxID=47427 RepID=A0A2H3E727_ARMGA|nr:hypothetical protein ARMGADRAFT_1069776 [Armillaria gallica]
MESSPPTWVDSKLIDLIQDQPVKDVIDEEQLSKPKPAISLRIKSPGELVPTNAFAHANQIKQIVVSLEESIMGKILQFGGTSYISNDEILRVRLETRLCKPGPELLCEHTLIVQVIYILPEIINYVSKPMMILYLVEFADPSINNLPRK